MPRPVRRFEYFAAFIRHLGISSRLSARHQLGEPVRPMLSEAARFPVPDCPMRLLYLSSAEGADYQCDMLFHGLRTLLGNDVVDIHRLWFMYADAFADDPARRDRLYGKGFSVYGLLGDDSGVDRDDIAAKIRNHYFDAVIFGSVHRCQMFLDDVLDAYDPQDILFIDGEDYPRQMFWPLLHRGLYFKREQDAGQHGTLPIQFAIPEEKIAATSLKTQVGAFIDPRDRSTYIYDDEAEYYADYRRSLFAFTMKKAGWDCLRHYEIMANRCVPVFLELDKCPPQTMVHFPRLEIWRLNFMLQEKGAAYFATPEGSAAWAADMERIVAFTRRHLTTAALARRVLDAWQQGRGYNHTTTDIHSDNKCPTLSLRPDGGELSAFSNEPTT